MDINKLTQQDIAGKLASQEPREPYNHFPLDYLDGPTREAAVLIPLFRDQDAWHLLLIRRSEIDGDHHSGQVAFPGGAKDPGDSDNQAAALREACEELAIEPADVQILGRLNDFITISNFQVTPVVGLIPWPYNFTPSPDEVSRVFSIPLAWLSDPSNYKFEPRQLPDGSELNVIYFAKYDGELLWGASALFTIELLKVLGLYNPPASYRTL